MFEFLLFLSSLRKKKKKKKKRKRQVKKKRKLFLGQWMTNHQVHICHQYHINHALNQVLEFKPNSLSGQCFAFTWNSKSHLKTIYNTNLLHSHWTIPLGPTYPCTNTVDKEPFSTLVFKVLIWIIATTTKICTKSCFTHTHVYALSHDNKRILKKKIKILSSHSFHVHLHVGISKNKNQKNFFFFFLLYIPTAKYKKHAEAPSIFRAISFGRWVITHSLADADFHGHCPAV